jgi:hypothetical protein
MAMTYLGGGLSFSSIGGCSIQADKTQVVITGPTFRITLSRAFVGSYINFRVVESRYVVVNKGVALDLTLLPPRMDLTLPLTDEAVDALVYYSKPEAERTVMTMTRHGGTSLTGISFGTADDEAEARSAARVYWEAIRQERAGPLRKALSDCLIPVLVAMVQSYWFFPPLAVSLEAPEPPPKKRKAMTSRERADEIIKALRS